MKKLLTIILALLPILAFSQIKYDSVRVVKPQNFVEAMSIDTAIVQIISQKAGVNRRVNFQTVADWILAQQPNLDSAQYANDTLLLFYGPDTILAVIPSGTIDTAYLSGDTLGIVFAGDTTEVVLVGLGDGNGLFDAANNNDTIRISTALLRSALAFQGNYAIEKTGNSSYSLLINNTGGIGITSTGTNFGGIFSAGNSNGVGVRGSTSGATAIPLDAANSYTAVTNDARPGLRLARTGIYTGAPGNGIYISFLSRYGYTGDRETARITAVSRDTSSLADGELNFSIINNGAIEKKVAIASTGQLTLDGYANNALNNVDSSIYVLAVDATGDVHTRAASGLGSDGNGIYDGSGTVSDSITVNFSGNGARFDSLGLYGLEITDGTTGPIDSQWKGVLRTLETHTSTNGYLSSGGPGNRSMVAESVVNLTGNASTQHWFNTFYSGIETAPSYSGNLNTGDFAGSPGLLSAQLNAHHKGSGDVTVHGLRVRVNNEGTGTIDKAANILIAGGKNDGGGIYTTEYGIYVDSASSAGTYYGLYDLTGNYFFQSRATPNFDMKFSNVSLSHPFTTTSSAVTTRTFGRITESSADLGGFTFQGYADSTGFSIGAVRFIGHVGQFSVPSDQEAFEFNAWKWNGGTTRTAMAGADIIASFEAGSTRKFAVNANGVINRDGGKGSVSTTTDGSGDVTVTHGLGGTPDNIQVTITGTTPYVATVHTIGATQFKVRIFDMAGAAVTSTSVSFHWVGEL